uniref:Origin recognition complex subunit 1 n=1 Tax=Pogona vitticeps TaxID=103695 RepID=A0A6J0TC97_9SAUR
MNREERKESSYSWIGKNIHTDKQSHISYYRGVKIQERKNLPEINIFLKEFILIETEEVGQQFVARLKKLYEDGAQEKYATVELFSRIADIPLSQRLSLGQEDSNEIFQNENIEQDTTILVTSIICTVPVIPLSPHELLPVMPKDVQIFFIRKSWDGKKFKPLSPRLLAELKDTVKMKSTDVNFATEYHLTPKHNVCSLEVEPELFIHSARKSQKSTLEVESRHTASKSSLVKQRRSERIAKGNHTPGAKKKLQLNSPTKSPPSKFAEQDLIELLDCDFTEPFTRSALKRKVKFSGNKGSPSKISCAADKGDLFLDIKLLEDHSDEMDTSLSSPCQRNQESSRKTRRSALKNTTIDSSDTVKQNEICKIANGLKDSKKQLTILHSNSKNQQSLGEEEVLTIGSLAETPRSRRKCAQITATRIAEQLGVLGTALVKGKEEDFLSPSGSSESSNSEDEKEVTMPVRPKRLTKSTRRSLRKPSGEKTPRDSCKTPEPRTPKTPRNAIPRIRNRNQTVQKPASVLEEARMRLHVSAVPESLPCREKEFQDIYNFIESKLINETGGCMYISGVPGTGKTATVHEAIHYLQQAVENNELPSFQFIEINGMKLTDPHQAYVQILKLLTGQKATANHAAELLEKMFCKPSSKRKTIVLVVDELDLLWTRKQNVMYNLFDWPTKKNAKLIVLAIANTMDLPERIMMNRVASRLGLTRMSFQPYTFKQLQTIISSRMNDLKAFEEEAIEFVSRKVAALSGDARRCLDICRRSTEICELADQKSDSGLVSITHVMKATDEMFSSPYINTIRNASLQEQIFLKATIAEFHRLGLEEATVHQVFHQHVALCRIEGLQTPTISEIMAIASRLSACRLLLAESSHKYLHMRIRLNVSQDDVMYALKKEE